MTVGRAIAEIRKEKKVTLKYLARATKYSIAYLSDIQRDRTNPSLRAFVRICNALNVMPGTVLDKVDRWTVREGVQPNADKA